jgi:hypothetical protein
MPALFISTSTSPKRPRTACSRRVTSSRRLTSVTDVITPAAPSGAALANAAAALDNLSSLTSAIQTRMPRLAKCVAAASPMPEAPPVITATELFVKAGWDTGRTPELQWEASIAADAIGRRPRYSQRHIVSATARLSRARPCGRYPSATPSNVCASPSLRCVRWCGSARPGIPRTA